VSRVLQLPYSPTLPGLLAHCVDRYGAHDLAVTDDGRRWSYADIDARSALLARQLLRAGIGKGCRVGLLYANGPDWLSAYFAVGRIGAVAVTISTFAKPPELAKIIRHSDIHLLLTGPALLGRAHGPELERALPDLAGAGDPDLFLPAAPFLRAIWVTGSTDRPWVRSAPWDRAGRPMVSTEMLQAAEAEVHAADPLAIVYTSGSTKDPKGVIHLHGTLVRQGVTLRACGTVRHGDRVYAGMPFFWIGGISFTLGPALAAGATLLLQERFDVDRAVEMIKREKATTLLGWITVFQRILEHPNFDIAQLPSLGDPAEGGRRPSGLGMTETCASHTDPRGVRADDPTSFGWALDGVEHHIVDPNTRVVLPAGEPGEICVRGYNLLAGMVKVERYDYLDGDGWFATGDKGWLSADGTLHFLGRLGDMIKVKGSNVAPAEVEAVLMAHPDVAFAAVVGLSDGPSGQAVGAAIVARNPQINLDAVLSWLHDQVASYKVPTRVLLFDDESLPTRNGNKVDKRALQEQLAAAPALSASAHR
jgi:acyl-CoA synthetase (AMP-forming)/AMP-acid ligase II